MSAIFVPAPGRLLAIRSEHPRALIFDVGEVQQSGLVTGLEIDQSVSAQFQPSLDRVVYTTPFGDNIGGMTINMILNNECDDSDDNTSRFISYYEKARLSPDNAVPVDMIIGSKAFAGYAIGFRITGDSSQGHMMMAQLKFAAWLAL